MPNPNDTNIIVDGQKVVATLAQSGTVVQDGGAIDATSVIQTSDGLQKVVKVMDVNGGGGGGGEQNIKAYHAPSATLDQTLLVIIPNVDAVKEQGLYNVDYSYDMGGADLKMNALLEVITEEASGQTLSIVQNILINFNESFVFATRVFEDNAWSAWAGKNIPAELAKCLQNTATGTSSLCILGKTTNNSNCVVIGTYSEVNDNYGVAINGRAFGQNSTSINGLAWGYQTISINGTISSNSYKAIALNGTASGNNSIQIGPGTNNTADLFQVYTYPMLDGNTGKIPNERLRLEVADTTNTSATIANVEGGKDYTFTNALTSLTITAITSSFVEANIYFTADTGITVTLPNNTPTIGDFTFTAGKSYVISIQNGIAVRGELN